MGLCQAIFDCQIASFLSQRCGFEDQFPGSSDPSLGQAILEHLQKTDAVLTRLMEQLRQQASLHITFGW